MMQKIFYSISIIITALFLCGFVIGTQIGDPEDKQLSEPIAPILEYEETIQPYKSNQELYKQYYLLSISSLEEAISSLQDKNQLWTYRMVHNSYKYVKLMSDLAIDDYKSEYGPISDDLKAISLDVKKRNINKSKKNQIKNNLKKNKKIIEENLFWGIVSEWIKQ